MRNKVLVFFACFFLLFSVVSLSCFASESVEALEPAAESVSNGNGIYNDTYELVLNYVYGLEVTDTIPAEISLVAVFLSTFLSVLVVALPFLVVWLVIKMILGFGARII